ncbi:MAG: 50S ribosomal protein L4 [Candidatus Harrisonbacteria bacterium RIFCSPLOWO2_02_FULL_41_13b]|uniref:Large ribosomal subunit protein uL4 n=1 Tax=Candidatus Harrisonbacteria bacterium RIFCSPLOWO2_02_FULL_41_13b TaxID=1798409 RepID=A0A1G1ZPT8_9BACT|nr:MAG: 50S ribosomal protein L4 [Candidatus Harrisonbacteria bacterium RIFCSPHIGHO2_02_FULL_40_20]OGY66698.1 MAG: 50S ribosomal protein L4 [Candidatus Harrisonbacteria bacterium RIFCSPLOWO2_02_FULL_41_13b]
MKAKVYNLKGEVVKETELSDVIFLHPWNSDLVYQALRIQTANRRHPLAHAKNRAEVSGGGRKPWKQKGTGRARQGSIRSPIWKGGGVTHGPTKEKIFARKLNKKMLRGAIHSVLAKRFKLDELKIVDSLELQSSKTKEIFMSLKNFLKIPNALLITAAGHKNIHLASRNIPKVKDIHASSLNVEDLLKYKNVLIEEKALSEIQ